MEVAVRAGCIEGVAQGLRPGMHRKVFGAGMGFLDAACLFARTACPMPSVVRRTLQAADHGHSQLAGQVGVFPIGFHAASPARVAEQVDVGGPESKPLVDVRVAFHCGQAVLDARLITHGCKHLIQQRFIERCRHAHRLREYGGAAVAGHPVQGLVPPVVGLDAQPGNGLGLVLHQRTLFFQREPFQQVGGAFLGGKALVQIRRALMGRPARNGRTQRQDRQVFQQRFHGVWD